jgi:DNA gyrase subunit A
VADYPVKGRGTKGVKTIQMTDRKGGLAGALIVREHQELLFISQEGMVQRTSVRGISKMGRATQGVKVMNVRNGDTVSAVAVVVESEAQLGADVAENGDSPNGDGVQPSLESEDLPQNEPDNGSPNGSAE